MPQDFYCSLGMGVASLMFGAALSIFIYAVASGIVTGIQAWLLFGTSFLLMMRFWWRYVELFVQFMPSKTFWHFLFDFAIAFFGILAVLVLNNIQTWAVVGMLAMLSSIARCSLSWKEAAREARKKLRRTVFGAFVVFIVMLLIYALSPAVSGIAPAAIAFAIAVVFVAYSSRKP